MQLKLITCLSVLLLLASPCGQAGSKEQAKRMHDRLAGIPPSAQVLTQMSQLLENGDSRAAADLAMDNPAFYSITLKHWVTPWTNEEGDKFAPLNDYSATVIGMVRDDVDFRQLLSGDILYLGQSSLGLPAYSNSSNAHYQAMEDGQINLKDALVASSQSAVTGLAPDATAGVMTTRAGARAFFKDGTNRAMFRFTLINHLCTDLEALKDTELPPDRIRQDVSRSPGGDSRIFMNSCTGCHSGMDPLAQAFAYYEFDYDTNGDPDGERGALLYNGPGMTDPDTGSRVTKKHRINANTFVHGFVIEDDRWDNYWREGINQVLGWSDSLPGSGNGAKSMGEELANSQAFAQCQASKVFEDVCLRKPQDSADRTQVSQMTNTFQANGYKVKDLFADAADYCKGD
ncbi:hypothetical protein P2G88_06340 [Aliiglaciecola sp. CAU 1673]|uniref:hypothetical protein n=1 Tax=Aliiglaciecola sp. CAU 1673 TaxID=3032595 RepID=UPI0023DCC785|nr:hypothetical protein [Aliiglaciecola sp. CAU 1673]MDF2177865.1 hypothetical protein [Aliiglaciecola sp. CAU 1673]